jgi:pimeloyl-ACP methyl ester carboxylesterase
MSEEWNAAGRLAGKALGGVVRIVGDTHKAVSDRVDSALPAVAKPYNRVQAASAQAVFGVVEQAHRQAPVALAGLGSLSSVEPSQTRVGRALHPVVNGFHGDLVADEHPQLSIPMAVRVDGRDADVATDFPDATADIVVFVHGLAEDETAWSRGGVPSYGERLRADGLTPVYVRFNSGLHISDNGRSLSDLLDEVVANWPVPVESISLVGHSMGGLVARSACHVGTTWTPLVTTVVTLGTPHLGAPLEKAVHVADWVMRRVPETEPIGRIIANRSVGVKDLRFGSLAQEDWHGRDIDAFLDDRRAEVPFLEDATYYWIAATLTRDPRHPWGRLVGDGMVRYPSASSLPGEGLCLGGVSHLDLLNDDVVFEALAGWLTTPEQQERPPAQRA